MRERIERSPRLFGSILTETETHSGCWFHVNNTHNSNIRVFLSGLLSSSSVFSPSTLSSEAFQGALITNARCSPLLALANVRKKCLHKAAKLILGCTRRLNVPRSLLFQFRKNKLAFFYCALMSCVISAARAHTYTFVCHSVGDETLVGWCRCLRNAAMVAELLKP